MGRRSGAGKKESQNPPSYLSWKSSLGQSPHCHTLLAGSRPNCFYTQRAQRQGSYLQGQRFQTSLPPSSLPLTPGGSLHFEEALNSHRLAQSCSAPAASTLGAHQL